MRAWWRGLPDSHCFKLRGLRARPCAVVSTLIGIRFFLTTGVRRAEAPVAPDPAGPPALRY